MRSFNPQTVPELSRELSRRNCPELSRNCPEQFMLLKLNGNKVSRHGTVLGQFKYKQNQTLKLSRTVPAPLYIWNCRDSSTIQGGATAFHGGESNHG